MATFIKAQAASLSATAVDFSVTVILKELFHCWYLLASILGTLCGGIVNFSMSRRWVFRARDKKIHVQVIKYGVVWAGNLVLVSSGVFALTNYGGISYLVSKITVSAMVGIFYNYVFQKKFVFK